MRKNFGVKTYLYPQPVLIIATYNEDKTPNAMNAAWGGICDYDKISIALSSHRTTDNILRNKAFTVSIGTKEMATACDYVGIVSGNKVPNKFANAGFTATRSENVDAPIINELPLTLECEFISFENEILIGKIVNVSADETILTDGEIDVKKLNPIVFDPSAHNYIELGDVVGKAFKIGNLIK